MAGQRVRRTVGARGRVAAGTTAAAVVATLAVGAGSAPAGAWSAPGRAVAVSTVSAAAAAAAAATVAPVPRAVVRRVDVDGDGRSDTVTLALARTTQYSYGFALTVRPARGRSVTLPVTVGRYRTDLTPAMVWTGAAPLDGVAGADLMLDLGGAVGDFPWLHAYTWRSGRLVNLAAPGATRKDISWHIMGPPFAVSGYTVGGPLTGARTVTRHELFGKEYAAATYRGTHTTYRWVGGAAGSWQRTGVKPSGVVSAAQAQRYGGWTGVTWR